MRKVWACMVAKRYENTTKGMPEMQKSLLEYTAKGGTITVMGYAPRRGRTHNKGAWIANQAVAMTNLLW